MCPDCQVMPLRVWDTFVVPTDNYAMGAVYAADNGAEVVEGAVGGLTNTSSPAAPSPTPTSRAWR